MNPRTARDSLFSSGKPQDVPAFLYPVLAGMVSLVVLFRWLG